MSWIIVNHWERHQHYRDRAPVWVKVYTELNRHNDWRGLTYAERGLLVSIWIEYAASDGRCSTENLGQLLGQQLRNIQLEPLIQAGFIQIVDSKPIALARSREKRREEKNYARARKDEKRLPFNAPSPPETPASNRTNAAAYKPFSHEPEELDEDTFITEVSRRAAEKGWRAPR